MINKNSEEWRKGFQGGHSLWHQGKKLDENLWKVKDEDAYANGFLVGFLDAERSDYVFKNIMNRKK